MVAAQAGENHGDEWELTWYLQWRISTQAWKFGKFKETIHFYHVCTPCGNDETNFCFPQILAEMTRKRW